MTPRSERIGNWMLAGAMIAVACTVMLYQLMKNNIFEYVEGHYQPDHWEYFDKPWTAYRDGPKRLAATNKNGINPYMYRNYNQIDTRVEDAQEARRIAAWFIDDTDIDPLLGKWEVRFIEMGRDLVAEVEITEDKATWTYTGKWADRKHDNYSRPRLSRPHDGFANIQISRVTPRLFEIDFTGDVMVTGEDLTPTGAQKITTKFRIEHPFEARAIPRMLYWDEDNELMYSINHPGNGAMVFHRI